MMESDTDTSDVEVLSESESPVPCPRCGGVCDIIRYTKASWEPGMAGLADRCRARCTDELF